MKSLKIAFLLLVSASISQAHVYLNTPLPRGHPSRNDYPKDYNLASPVKSICGGKPPGPVTAIFEAGKSVDVRLNLGASHEGGGCAFSLSYDAGQTFTVIYMTDASCPVNPHWQVPIAASTPACNQSCVFSWSWIPVQSGQPEYYHNCVDIQIKRPSGSGNGIPLSGPSLIFDNIENFPVTRHLLTSVYTSNMNGGPVKLKSGASFTAPTLVTRTVSVSTTPTAIASTPVARVRSVYQMSDKCIHGQVVCLGSSSLGHCSYGIMYRRPCPRGTVCRNNQCELQNN